VKGKIGVGGNSKKRRYAVKIGVNTITTKNIKFSFNRGVIKTSAGALGFKCMLHYK
jgi:hypothetical protein